MWFHRGMGGDVMYTIDELAREAGTTVRSLRVYAERGILPPPEVKGRQWDYPFGANLNYIPRAEDGVSFAELRGLADALPLLRAVIETR